MHNRKVFAKGRGNLLRIVHGRVEVSSISDVERNATLTIRRSVISGVDHTLIAKLKRLTNFAPLLKACLHIVCTDRNRALSASRFLDASE